LVGDDCPVFLQRHDFVAEKMLHRLNRPGFLAWWD